MIISNGTEISMLRGEELQGFVTRCRAQGLTNAQIVEQSGYYRYRNGDKKLCWTRFYEELAVARGIMKRIDCVHTGMRSRHEIFVNVNATERTIVSRCKARFGMSGVKCNRIKMNGQITLQSRECDSDILIIIL